MTAEIRIYVEGGGDSKHTRMSLRQGFNAFLKSIRDKARERRVGFQIIMCGGRDDACQDYLLALRSHQCATNILLVDSDGPVANSPGDHLRQRDWHLPQPFDDRYHLMVQAMEAWFVADADALAAHYGQHFNRQALPVHSNLESISVTQLSKALKTATRGTAKGEYRKIQHAAKLLPKLNVVRVRSALPHCNAFFQFLESLL